MRKYYLGDEALALSSNLSTYDTFVEHFELPPKFRFTVKWKYTVDSYAGNRLYKYGETREVVQEAKFLRVVREKKDLTIREILVCDSDKVVIQKKNLDNETRTKYEEIISLYKEDKCGR